MKISKLFHWLYCAVMFLPLFVLPIFALAVRSDNNYQPIEVQQDVNEVVVFNQLLDNSSFSNKSVNGLDVTIVDNIYSIDGTIDTSWVTLYLYSSNLLEPNNKYYIRSLPVNSPSVVDGCYGQVAFTNTISGTRSSYINTIFTTPNSFNNVVISFQCGSSGITLSNVSYAVNLFNLTKMFGTGNEPSLEQFNSWYSNAYYDYDLGTKELLHTGISDTLNDTDFGSQTIYTLYKEVDEYFNYDDVLSIGELYDWCNFNLFNGNATLGFFIFFHLLEYWLLTSLLWLIFDILMYVPQLCHRWLDKASLE